MAGRPRAEKYDPMHAGEPARESRVELVWKNRRRCWMMDRLTFSLAGDDRDFKGIMFHLVARMQMPPAFSPEGGQKTVDYNPMQIRRVSTYGYMAGKPVSLLRSPDGRTLVMQTFMNFVDFTLTEADLPNLATRLKLGEGWQFRAKTLDRNLFIETTGFAEIVADDLANMYPACIDNVSTFDPAWE